jgi:hypothetical protein
MLYFLYPKKLVLIYGILSGVPSTALSAQMWCVPSDV